MANGIEQRVVITDFEALLAPGIELLRARGVTVDVVPEGTDAAGIAAAAAEAPAAIVGIRPMRAPEIATLRATGLLIRAGIGYDIIDVAAATEKGIWVANVPDYCVDEVADHAVLLLMSAWRRLSELEHIWHEGKWVNPSITPPVHRTRGPPPGGGRVRADRPRGGDPGARLRLGGRRVRPVAARRSRSGRPARSRSASTTCSRRLTRCPCTHRSRPRRVISCPPSASRQ